MAGLTKVLETSPPLDMRAIDRRSGKPKQVSSAVRKVVRLLLSGECKTIKAAGERAKLTPEYLSSALRMPHVRHFIDEQTRAALDAGKPLAAGRMLELIHAKSEHVSADVSARVLAIGNIQPPTIGTQVNIQNNVVAPGYVIDLTPWAPIPAKVIDAEAEEITNAGGRP